MPRLKGVKVLDMKDGEVTRIEYDGEVYTKIDGCADDFKVGDIALRKPKPGDKIRIVNAHHVTGGQYKNGDILTVKKYIRGNEIINERVIVEEFEAPTVFLDEFEFVDESELKPIVNVGDFVKVSVNNAKHEKRDVAGWVRYEPVTFYDKPAQVGDKILINEQAWGTQGKYAKGDVLTVVRVDSDGNVWETEELGGKFIEKSEYEVIVEENTPQFKVGDFAKVVGETFWGDIRKGTIVKITDEVNEEDYICFETLDGNDFDYAKAESLEKVNPTDRELSFIRADRELSFIRADRNVGEFKKGDIAYVISKEDERIVGRLVEVLSEPIGTFDGGNVHVKFGDLEIIVLGDNLKLIAPVESRSDIERSESDE